jgi:hypothetical protein
MIDWDVIKAGGLFYIICVVCITGMTWGIFNLMGYINAFSTYLWLLLIVSCMYWFGIFMMSLDN